MSRNRENVIWQSPSGTWNRGFFDYVVTGPDDEWDVEYDHRTFNWVSTGHPTMEAAHAAWDGANPGMYHRVPWNDKNRAEIERYEKMASEFQKSAGADPLRWEEEEETLRPTKSRAQLDRDIRGVLARGKKPYSW